MVTFQHQCTKQQIVPLHLRELEQCDHFGRGAGQAVTMLICCFKLLILQHFLLTTFQFSYFGSLIIAIFKNSQAVGRNVALAGNRPGAA